MNSKIVISSLFVLLSVGCKNNSKHSNIIQQSKQKTDSILIAKSDTTSFVENKEKIKQELNEIVPDTTINGKLFLENYDSLSKFYLDYKSILTTDKIRESPVVIFNNRSKTQYLLAYHYEGGTKNSFDCFEIGYFVDDEKLNKIIPYKIDEEFNTESNLGLGISFEKLVKIKGDNYKTQTINGEKVITYRIDNYDSSPFLKRYNMPGYFMEFKFKENKVIKITFGFDYP